VVISFPYVIALVFFVFLNPPSSIVLVLVLVIVLDFADVAPHISSLVGGSKRV
jgi:hypothetical protein